MILALKALKEAPTYGHSLFSTQIVQNLIENSIQHVENPDGTIIISCKDLGRSWEFCVRDNGVGIGKRHFKSIF